QQSGTFALAGLLLPNLSRADYFFAQTAATPVGLQLYTLGSLMTTDAKGTLEKLAAIGYKEVESAGSQKGNYYGYTPKEFSAMVKEAGMHWRSAHIGGASFDMAAMLKRAKNAEDSVRIQRMIDGSKDRPKTLNFTDDYQQLADDAAAGGLSYMVCSSIPVGTMDQIKTAADVFSKAGEACKKNGVQFAYHNHVTEFDQIEGHRPFDYILDNTDKDLVKMELDLAWATKAKQDPVELFKLHPGRYPLWHAKDLDKTTMNPAEVGTGVVDFKRIFANAKLSGMKYFFVEQDGAPQPLQNVTNSYNYLKEMMH
ncbi:MAG TPA: sugar phosphate isomerase/epimerase, partial [Chitinophagaceae bacterium]|nr:sugar phosphate isomerase/epimerase [Chitinophagaceae bacterium]